METARISSMPTQATVTRSAGIALIGLFALCSSSASAQSSSMKTRKVTVDNYVRAETDQNFASVVRQGGLGKFVHVRDPMPLGQQHIIRSNRDTLYSNGVFDLDAGPLTITLPNAHKRFMSMQVIDEDHYVVEPVIYTAGIYTFLRDKVGTRYVMVIVRTLVNPNDSYDPAQVH